MNFQRKFEVAFVGAMIFLLLLFASCPPKAHGQNKPNMFQGQPECEVALSSGNFSYYAPVDLSRSKVSPIDGKTVFGVKLEADSCRHQRTMKGWQWVVQSADSMMRAHKDAAGNLVIFARNDCGNGDDTESAPTVTTGRPAPNPTLAQAQVPVIVNVYNDSSAETTAPASQNYGGGGVATGGIPAGAVLDYDLNGCVGGYFIGTQRFGLLVPIMCPVYQPGYAPRRYEEHRREYYRGGRPNPTPTPTPKPPSGGGTNPPSNGGKAGGGTNPPSNGNGPIGNVRGAVTQRSNVAAPKAQSGRVASAFRGAVSSASRGYSGGRSGGGHR